MNHVESLESTKDAIEAQPKTTLASGVFFKLARCIISRLFSAKSKYRLLSKLPMVIKKYDNHHSRPGRKQFISLAKVTYLCS